MYHENPKTNKTQVHLETNNFTSKRRL